MSDIKDFFASGGSDPTAIHDNQSGEISAIAEKASPISADLILIEDSAAANVKKKVQIGNLPSGGSGAEELSDLTDVGVTTPTNRNVLVGDGDSFESRALVEADISDLQSYLTSETSHADVITESDVDDTPVDSATTAPISSNWAYDHVNGADPHTVYKLESEMGTGAVVNIHVGTSAPGSPNTGDLWVDTN